mmetsp:Transcript_18530/g.31147  ORF Transcript_18530/g.31147 Transcript_18530/m.31147 type:complete len:265 (+) Transcript_18530:159-953(+)
MFLHTMLNCLKHETQSETWSGAATLSNLCSPLRSHIRAPTPHSTPLLAILMRHSALSPLPASDLRDETGLDSTHRARSSARLTPQDEQTLLPAEQSVRALAHITDHILVHVATQDTLEHLRCEASFHDKTLLSVQRPRCTQLRVKVPHDVLRLSVHRLAQLHKVDEHGLLCAFAQHLRRLEDRLLLLACQLGVVCEQHTKYASEHLIIMVVARAAFPRQTVVRLRGSIFFLIRVLRIHLFQTVEIQSLLLFLLLLSCCVAVSFC